MKKDLRIHFLGIGGSGVNAIATLAREQGYDVSGCDMNEDTAYTEKLHKLSIKTFTGHSKEHLQNIDILVVTPAIYYMNQDNEEVAEAKKKNIPVVTWQEFLGQYLLKDKETICVAGTHGKSTTTSLLSLVFEVAGMDPSCVIGAKVSEWQANSRLGKSDLFIVEADEFNNNFLNYSPETIILNNIEFDHPDFFKSEKDVVESFSQFIQNLKGKKNLIFNQDSPGIQQLFEKLGEEKLSGINLMGYTFSNEKINLENSTKIKLIDDNVEFTSFEIILPDGETHKYRLKIPGIHNVLNATGIILASKLYGIDKNYIDTVFEKFEGIGRRLEMVGEKGGVKVFDDYAHHPTAIKVTIGALRQKFPKNKIIVLVEAHGFARTKALLPLYENVFEAADKVIIGPIFKARDSSEFGVNEQSIAIASKHANITAIDNIDLALKSIVSEVKKGDIVLVMGAGDSYKWSREILAKINE